MLAYILEYAFILQSALAASLLYFHSLRLGEAIIEAYRRAESVIYLAS